MKTPKPKMPNNPPNPPGSLSGLVASRPPAGEPRPSAFALNRTPEQEQQLAPPASHPDDIIGDVLARIAERVQIAALVLIEVEMEVRRDWAGDRPYIAATGEQMRAQISARNGRVYSEWRKGERIPLLARRYGVSERRIRQIIDSQQALHRAGK